MTPKSLLGLAAVTAAAVAVAVTVQLQGGAGSVAADRGRPLLPDLAGKANAVAAIAVTTGKGEVDLTRKGDGFVDASGYPVKRDAVRALLTSLATLTIFEDKTDQPGRYADLALAAPDAKTGGATAVVLKGKDGAGIAGLFAGTKDYTVGGSRGGQYVRLAGQARSYLVRGAIDVPSQRADWFDTRLADVAPDKIAKADLVDRAGEEVALAASGGKLTLASLPEGKVADDGKLDQIAHLFQRFDFIDVRKAAAMPASAAAHVRIETTDGLALTLTEVPAAGKDDGGWVRIAAEAATPAAAAAAKAIAARVDGFAFRIAPATLQIFGWTPDDLTKAAGG